MAQTITDQNLSSSLKALAANFSQVLLEILAIAKLETRLAGISLFAIVLLLFISSLLCFAIWLSLLLAAVGELLRLGFSWPMVLLQLAGLNLVLLILAGWGIKRCGKNLLFTATRRQINSNPFTNKGQAHVETTQETDSTV